jgi:hypothetical protein
MDCSTGGSARPRPSGCRLTRWSGCWGLYRSSHAGWNVKHFHEHVQKHHGFRWGYTWTKTQLHAAGLVDRVQQRGAHRRQRPRKPCVGMMLHQDGSRERWLEGCPPLDLIVTMDDATSELYSALLVEEESTASTFRACLQVFGEKGLPSSSTRRRTASSRANAPAIAWRRTRSMWARSRAWGASTSRRRSTPTPHELTVQLGGWFLLLSG